MIKSIAILLLFTEIIIFYPRYKIKLNEMTVIHIINKWTENKYRINTGKLIAH